MHAFAQKLALVFCGGIWLSAASAQNHFQPVNPTMQSYSIVVTSATINNIALNADDEIGVFSRGLCVGATKLPPLTNIQIAAWRDNPQTSQIDGYVPGDTMRFKIWDNSTQRELPAQPFYQSGNGTFENGLFAILSLAATVTTEVRNAAAAELPADFVLQPNYPNPFNPSTTIKFAIPGAGKVKLAVYNLSSELVQTLVDGEMKTGYHQLTFDASYLASGVYFYRLDAGAFSATRKMILQK